MPVPPPKASNPMALACSVGKSSAATGSQATTPILEARLPALEDQMCVREPAPVPLRTGDRASYGDIDDLSPGIATVPTAPWRSDTPYGVKLLETARLPSVVASDDLARTLRNAGLDRFLDAFVAQDISDLAGASSLSTAEIETVFRAAGFHPTVGLVRHLHSLFTSVPHSPLWENVQSTPSSVLSRSMLSLKPQDLKQGLNNRLNAETIFASLMLTIAAAALIEIPDPATCDPHLGKSVCHRLRIAYLISWGLAAAFFSQACVISLGAMQMFFSNVSEFEVHDRFIASEAYFASSHPFITIGLVGLLIGICFNTLLRFPEMPWACACVNILIWLLYLYQLRRGAQAIWNVFHLFPGFVSTLQFAYGYLSFRSTILLGAQRERVTKYMV